MEYKSNQNIVYSCKYPVIWCPKYRRRVLTSEVEERLKAILLEVAQERKAEIIKLEVMPDHVHLLVEVNPQKRLASRSALPFLSVKSLFASLVAKSKS